jgi:hypothetical protein
MARFFNTTGPCRPDEHYMLPPEARLRNARLDRYIGNQLYWVLHAPRQTGKTTFLQSWMCQLNACGRAVACYVSVERCQGMPAVETAVPNLIEAVVQWAARNGVPVPAVRPAPVGTLLNQLLADWAAQVAPRPLVVLFDEVDVLEGPALISFLRQLRDGFAGRGVGRFPVSVALVGMRDLRDYLVRSKEGVPLNPGSPFNIKESSATLANFSREDIAALTAQHTAEKGQAFTPEALERIWHWTSGQPWLVNAICKSCVWDLVPEETREPVTEAHVEQAVEAVIQSRATHIDSLAERLREDRVRRVVQPIVIGTADPLLAQGDDFRLCADLGLVALDENRTPVIANAVYREVLARTLSEGMQLAIAPPTFRWQAADGSLDMDALLREFQKFWAWNSETWESMAEYPEAFPHLLLMAFLQRVANGGGRIEREFAAGRGRVDLFIEFGPGRHVIEIKLVHPRQGREATRDQGLEQTAWYADRVHSTTRHLVIFDRRPEWRAKPWEERLGWEVRPAPDSRTVTVVWA